MDEQTTTPGTRTFWITVPDTTAERLEREAVGAKMPLVDYLHGKIAMPPLRLVLTHAQNPSRN